MHPNGWIYDNFLFLLQTEILIVHKETNAPALEKLQWGILKKVGEFLTTHTTESAVLLLSNRSGKNKDTGCTSLGHYLCNTQMY